MRVSNVGALFREAREACERTFSAPSPNTGGQADALGAIILSAAAVERFLSELATLCRDPGSGFAFEGMDRRFKVFADTILEMEHRGGAIHAQFWLAKWIFSGAGYVEGEQPFQDFVLLIDLRDALVHFGQPNGFGISGATNELLWAELPEPVRQMAARGILADRATASWVDVVTTCAAATWACNAASAIVMSLIESLPRSSPAEKFRVIFTSIFAPIESTQSSELGNSTSTGVGVARS